MLLPVSTYERQAVGLFPLKSGLSVEGGYVGQVTAGVSTQHNQPVVNLFNPGSADGYGSDTDLSLIGLIDDSTTGTKLSGNGNTGMIGKTLPSFETGTHVGPSSTFGSGKCTLWMDSGIFITDQFGTGVTVASAVGTALYAGTTGKLNTSVSGPQVGTVIKVFTGGLASIDSATRELLGVLPRVQSLPTSTTLLLFKFK